MEKCVKLEWPECQQFMEGGEHPCKMFYDPDQNVWFVSEKDYHALYPKEFFEITSVSRVDLEDQGFDAANIDDTTMEHLASKLADDYCDQLFRESLGIIAEVLDIPKKRK